MSDYNKLTVVQLKQVLKERGIASTGLTRKAQIVEKLEEEDAKAKESANAVVEEETEVVEDQPAVEEEAAAQVVEETQAVESEEKKTDNAEQDAPVEEQAQEQLAPADTETPSAPAGHIDSQIAEPVGEQSSAPEAETQTQVTDFADIRTPSADANEKPSVEKAELLPIPETTTNSSLEVSRLNTEELETDSKKRKRRSDSPDLSTQDVKAKKQRPSEEFAPDVRLQEDKDVVMEQGEPDNAAYAGDAGTNGVGDAKKEEAAGNLEDNETKLPDSEAGVLDAPKPQLDEESKLPKSKGPRYKELFQPAAQETTSALQQDDRPTVPALHPVTPGLYIRNFMRPLHPNKLREHLVTLATPASSKEDPSIVAELFLDAMKTHALVLFTSTTAASRVRASLHGSVWPPERNRQELWVDFIPDEKVKEWISEEEDAIKAEKEARANGQPIPPKRFEVVYETTDDDSMRAIFQEVGSSAPVNAPKGPRADLSQQFQRRSSALDTSLPPSTNELRKPEDSSKSFQTLDSLFSSTTAKPKLYFLPVDETTAQDRLDELRTETSRDWKPEDRIRGRGRGRLDQKCCFSFDAGNRLVETGGDFGPWADDSREGGFRGGRGGGGPRGGWRGGGGGGFRSEMRGGGGGGGFGRGGRRYD